MSKGWELTHVRDHNQPRTADETWVPRFAQEGGKGLLSADRKMLARPHQILAIQASGLIGVFLDAKWAEAPRHAQAAHILWWWPRIEIAFAESAASQCWRVPFDFSAKAPLTKVTPNYEKAARAGLSGKAPP